jgi:DeoR/GlpR family transcriptional regulator of sugar metabolism
MIAMSKKIRGEKRKKIYELIKKKEKISLKEIKMSTGINYNTIRSAVIGLTNSGLIERIGRGIYKLRSE